MLLAPPSLLALQFHKLLPAIVAPLLYLAAILIIAWRAQRAVATAFLLVSVACLGFCTWISGAAAGEIALVSITLVAMFAWIRACRTLFLHKHAAANVDALAGAMTPRGFRNVILGLTNLGPLTFVGTNDYALIASLMPKRR